MYNMCFLCAALPTRCGRSVHEAGALPAQGRAQRRQQQRPAAHLPAAPTGMFVNVQHYLQHADGLCTKLVRCLPIINAAKRLNDGTSEIKPYPNTSDQRRIRRRQPHIYDIIFIRIG